jgi:hypothetical protein
VWKRIKSDILERAKTLPPAASYYDAFRSTLEPHAWVYCPFQDDELFISYNLESMRHGQDLSALSMILMQSRAGRIEQCGDPGRSPAGKQFIIDTATSAIIRKELDSKSALWETRREELIRRPMKEPEIYMDTDGKTELIGIRRAYVLAAFVLECSCFHVFDLDGRPRLPMVNKDEIFRHACHHDGLHDHCFNVDMELSNLSISLVRAAGLNPQSTLSSDMDDLDPRFTCGTCCSSPQFDWRHAVSRCLPTTSPYEIIYNAISYSLLTTTSITTGTSLD